MKEEERFKITSPGCVGCIYIITNPRVAGIKIGYADSLDNRLRDINRSSVLPTTFRAYAYYEVDKRLLDKDLHRLIDLLRPDLRVKEETEDGKTRVREFFDMPLEDAYDVLECIAKVSGTLDRLHKVEPDEREIKEEEESEDAIENTRRSRFNFTDCEIPIGSELVYIKDPTKKVKVVDNHRVEYDGEITSLSRLAREWLGYKLLPQGQQYFTYEGEVLTDRRDRIESKVS